MNSWLVWDTPPGGWAVGLALAIAAIVAARHYVLARLGGPAILRGLALVLLVLTVFRPALRFVEPPTVARPVRVVLDDSLSMASVDANRSPGDWLRVAAALGRYSGPAAKPSGDFARLRGAIVELDHANQALAAARQADPISATERQHVANARAAAVESAEVLLATAQRIGCLPATVETLRQLQQAIGENVDANPSLQLLDSVAAEFSKHADADDDHTAATDASAMQAVQQVSTLSRFQLAVAATRRLRTMLPAGMNVADLDGGPANLTTSATPTASASPLTAALRDACGRAAAESAEAVVLVSDGRSTEPRSLLATVASTNVPVFTVAVAPEDRSPDARITRLDARPAVLAGQSVLVKVRVSQRNAAGRNVRVVLTDGKTEQERVVALGSDNTFEVTWPDARPPRLHLTARADALPGEIRLQNNSISTDVAVLDRREQILMLAGTNGPDITDLAFALGNVPWVQVHRHRLSDDTVDPLTAADCDNADVIIMADVPEHSLDDAAWAKLTRAVQQGGKSLLVMAGGGEWMADPVNARRLAPLLPTVAGPRPTWITSSQQVWPVPTRFGSEAAFLRLDESAEASLRAWLGRPKLSRYLAVGPPAPAARTLLIDRTSQSPLLVEAASGGGRSVLILTDEVWRWATASDSPEAAHLFWLGLSQYLFEFPYISTNDGLSIGVDRPEVAVGRGATVRMRTADPAGGPVLLNVNRQGVPVSTPGLRELLPGGGHFTASLNLPPGNYDLVMHQDARQVSTPLHVLPDDQIELADTTPDVGLLKRIGDVTSGSTLPIDQLDRLPQLLAQRRERDIRVATYELWCSPYWFAAIVACLGLEWAWRAKAGLA